MEYRFNPRVQQVIKMAFHIKKQFDYRLHSRKKTVPLYAYIIRIMTTLNSTTLRGRREYLYVITAYTYASPGRDAFFSRKSIYSVSFRRSAQSTGSSAHSSLAAAAAYAM
jgi:hypothetical protein